MARHCRDEDHPYNDVVGSPLYSCSKSRKLNKLEEYYTITSLYNNSNNNTGKLLNDTDSVTFNGFVRYMSNQVPQVDV